MRRRLSVIAGVGFALALTACQPTGDATRQATASPPATSPRLHSAEPSTPEIPPPASSPIATPSTATAPPAVTREPLTWHGSVGNLAPPPLPALPAEHQGTATLTLAGSWSGGFTLQRTTAKVGVSCSYTDAPGAPGDPAHGLYQFAVSTSSKPSAYGMPDGHFYVHAAVGYGNGPGRPPGIEIDVYGTDHDGTLYKIPVFDLPKTGQARIGPTTRSLTFAATAVSQPEFALTSDRIAGVSVSGTISCPPE